MALKDLIIFADDRPSCAERVRVAAGLARRFDAHLTGAHVAGYGPMPFVLDGVGVEQLIAVQEEAIAAAANAAEEKFREQLRRESIPHDWRTVRGPVVATASLEARCKDLAIVGQRDSDSDVGVQPDDVALLSGRPVLAVPFAGRYPTVGENPLIAWKPTREAARAVADALPLLRAAKRATILVVNPDEEEEATDNGLVGDELAAHLRRHGIESTVERTRADDITVADLCLSRAADLGSDLLVMGCYGHSRMRQFVLGGVTRDILRRMTLPVLMSH
jgi:nucleotide-binding universal stress UspA family protein